MKLIYVLLFSLVFLVLISIGLLIFFVNYNNPPDNNENYTGGLGSAGVFSNDNGGNISDEELTGELGSLNPISNSDSGITDMFPETNEMHWSHMPVTYSVSNCSEARLERISQAIDYIETKTEVISFEGSDENPDILIICTNEQKDRGYVAGEAELNYYVGTNIYANSKVYIYYSNHCIGRRPTIEIHELLHIFGLGHSSAEEWGNIMNPYTTQCEVDISDEDIAYLKKVYYTSRGFISGNVISNLNKIDLNEVIKDIFRAFNPFH